MNAILGRFYFRHRQKLKMRRGFIKFLSFPVKLMRINLSDISQIGGTNGYADDR